MDLKDMFPSISTFKIEIDGVLKEVALKKLTLFDQMKWEKEFNCGILSNFQGDGFNIDNVCRIVYGQIVPEHTQYFKKKVGIDIVDENGEEKKAEIGGYLLLADAVKDLDVLRRVVEAFTLCYFNSQPIADEIKNAQKKKSLLRRIGEKFSFICGKNSARNTRTL